MWRWWEEFVKWDPCCSPGCSKVTALKKKKTEVWEPDRLNIWSIKLEMLMLSSWSGVTSSPVGSWPVTPDQGHRRWCDIQFLSGLPQDTEWTCQQETERRETKVFQCTLLVQSLTDQILRTRTSWWKSTGASTANPLEGEVSGDWKTPGCSFLGCLLTSG